MMNPKGRVFPYLKRLARDLLPPMFARGLKALMIDHAGDDPLRIIKRTQTYTLLAGGIRIHHRDSPWNRQQQLVFEVALRAR